MAILTKGKSVLFLFVLKSKKKSSVFEKARKDPKNLKNPSFVPLMLCKN